jgi:predicted DNA-binding transcriptional regulator YafY
MLDEIGLPVYVERGPAGGYALARGYKLPHHWFSHPKKWKAAAPAYVG